MDQHREKAADKIKMDDKELAYVTGGAPEEIKVDIKTLQGDNDEYTIRLTDTVQQLIDQYTPSKQ